MCRPTTKKILSVNTSTPKYTIINTDFNKYHKITRTDVEVLSCKMSWIL
jgi:hypothetical protein